MWVVWGAGGPSCMRRRPPPARPGPLRSASSLGPAPTTLLRCMHSALCRRTHTPRRTPTPHRTPTPRRAPAPDPQARLSRQGGVANGGRCECQPGNCPEALALLAASPPASANSFPPLPFPPLHHTTHGLHAHPLAPPTPRRTPTPHRTPTPRRAPAPNPQARLPRQGPTGARPAHRRAGRTRQGEPPPPAGECAGPSVAGHR